MTRLISVSDEVYELLNTIKVRERAKSFTQVILELAGRRKYNINELFGKLKMSDEDADRLKNEIAANRKKFFKVG